MLDATEVAALSASADRCKSRPEAITHLVKWRELTIFRHLLIIKRHVCLDAPQQVGISMLVIDSLQKLCLGRPVIDRFVDGFQHESPEPAMARLSSNRPVRGRMRNPQKCGVLARVAVRRMVVICSLLRYLGQALTLRKVQLAQKVRDFEASFRARQEHESMLSAFTPMTCAASFPKHC